MHFEFPSEVKKCRPKSEISKEEKSDKKKGRPKKAKRVLEIETNNILSERREEEEGEGEEEEGGEPGLLSYRSSFRECRRRPDDNSTWE